MEKYTYEKGIVIIHNSFNLDKVKIASEILIKEVEKRLKRG